MAWLGENHAFFGSAIGVAFLAWSVAYFAMVLHRANAGHVSEDDSTEWKKREVAKLGGLVPFTYLLASPEQRRILRYLGKKKPTQKPRHWYGSRF